jgi:adenosylmethionine-8-amino-7-oxononanoate aminotransferase
MASNYLDKDKKYVWHPFTQMMSAPDPLVIVKAKDSLIIDEDGNEFIDVNSSWWVNVLGHG